MKVYKTISLSAEVAVAFEKKGIGIGEYLSQALKREAEVKALQEESQKLKIVSEKYREELHKCQEELASLKKEVD